MINSVSFGANYIQESVIKQYNPNTKTYTPKNVSFVELIPSDKKDIDTLKQLTKEWYDATLIRTIWEDMLECNRDFPGINARFFAITTQQKELKHLKSEHILGVAEMGLNNPQIPFLEFLQVNPKFIQQPIGVEFKHIGTALLNSLKNIYSSITLFSVSSALKFYEKNAFKVIQSSLLCHWAKNKY